MHQQPQESIWGTINSCVEIALNIYMIIAVDEHGVEHSGIMAHKDTEGNTLSQKAAQLAEREGDWLHFDENSKDAALYEVLEKRLELCKKIEASVMHEMAEIKKGCQILLPQYFGECRPPEAGPDVAPEPLRNGIYLMKNEENTTFAVHESIAEQYLTPMALQFGEPEGEYLTFDLTHCAIPIFELKDVFEEVGDQIVSADSLYATLYGTFGDYVKAFHDLVPVDQQIPGTDAPQNLFLPVQLNLHREDDDLEELAQDETYGEDVEFGIEP